jgi:hypothetical protein
MLQGFFGQLDAFPIQLPIIGGELAHFDGLIHGDVAEDLSGAARRPVNFQSRDPLCLR